MPVKDESGPSFFLALLFLGRGTGDLTLDPADHRSRVTEGIIRNMYDGILLIMPFAFDGAQAS